MISWNFDVGNLITIGLAVVGLIGGYFTLKAKSTELEGKTKELDAELASKTENLNKRLDAYGIAVADLRTHVAESCVRKDDLQRVEDRLTNKMEKVEHSIRNTLMEVLRSGRSRARGDE